MPKQSSPAKTDWFPGQKQDHPADHNSLKQQYYLEKIIKHDILKGKIDYVHGVELQSSEEIHLLAYFKKGSNLNVIQEWIDKHLIKVKNQSDYYGNQYIYNEFDEDAIV